MTLEEAMEAGAATFDAAEQRAKEIRNLAMITRQEFADLKEVFQAVRDAGHLGGIECAAIIAKCNALAATSEANAIQHIADVYSVHADLTDRAKEEGIDDLLPAPASGGR